jgi:alkylation response protein AidB-like acyl-CoA dehydrogenase
MDFDISPTQRAFLDRVTAFMDEHIVPAIPTYEAEMDVLGAERWKVIPVVEELKAKAKDQGIWNLFMPPRNDGHHHVDDTYPLRRSGPDQSRIRAVRRGDGQDRLCLRSVQLLGARHRQYGSVPPLRHARAEGAVAHSADERRDPLRLPDDRALHRVVRRHQYRDPHRARRRRICHQRPQVVVLGPGRSALQGRDRDGQDRSPMPGAMRSSR